MESTPTSPDREITIRDLYPMLSEEELKEAEARLTRYFEIAFEIVQEQMNGSIDTSDADPTMRERSNSSQKK